MGTTDNRKTSYAIEAYPDSCDIEALRSFLSGLHVNCCMSPLHDKDTYDKAAIDKYQEHFKDGTLDPDTPLPELGALKKPHYHILFTFGRQKKSIEFMREMLRPFFGDRADRMWIEPVHDCAAYTKYLCHLTKECRELGKAIYNVNEVQAFGDFDLSPLYQSSVADQEGVKRVIFEWIVEYKIYNWPDLVDIAYAIGDPLVIKTVTSGQNTAMYQRYIDGNYQRDKGLLPRSMHPDTIASAIKAGYRPVSGLPDDVSADDFQVVA